jgi:hypothetical protein
VLGDGSVTFALSAEGGSPGTFVLSAEGGSPVYLDRLALDGTRDPGFAGPHSTALTPSANGFLVHFELAAGGQVTAAETVRPGCRPVSDGTKTGFPCHSVLLVVRDADGRLRRGFGRDGMAVLRLPRRPPRRAGGAGGTTDRAADAGSYRPLPDLMLPQALAHGPS